MSKFEELLNPLRQTVKSAARLMSNARSRAGILTSEVAHDSRPIARHALRFADVARKQWRSVRAAVRKEALAIREASAE